jgi:hypothetical protein
MKNRLIQSLIILLSISVFQSCSSDSDDPSYFDVSHTQISFANNSTESITINSTESWEAEASFPSGTAAWFEFSPKNGQAGNNRQIALKVTGLNYGNENRAGTLTIKTKDQIKTVTVVQEILPKIELSAASIEIPFTKVKPQQVTLTINTNWTFRISKDDSFLLETSVSPQEYGKAGTYTFTFSAPDNEGDERTAKVYINSGDEEKVINITQRKYENIYEDKDVIMLQSATKGNGVHLVFMGDGFTQETMTKGTGKYELAMRQAMEHFFSIEPYKSYRSYFNVYMVAAISEESGIGDAPGEVNNKFGCYFGAGTLIEYNSSTCIEYTGEAFRGTNVARGDITVGLILNSTKYAGTCTMWSDGFSIARCPMSKSQYPYDFRGLLQHELGGHGFARAADEYITYNNSIPQSEINNRRPWQLQWNAYRNVDFTDDVTQVFWADFIGLPKYADVGVYEGGMYYAKGVWRSEHNSCMNNNVPYYNAPTRWSAVQRIMQIAGQPFTFEQFVQTDVIDQSGLTMAKMAAEDRSMPPLHPPILIE